MKKILVASMLAFAVAGSAASFANEAPKSEAEAPKAAKVMTKAAAKKACLAENAKLAGKDLAKCIREKRK